MDVGTQNDKYRIKINNNNLKIIYIHHCQLLYNHRLAGQDIHIPIERPWHQRFAKPQTSKGLPRVSTQLETLFAAVIGIGFGIMPQPTNPILVEFII